MTMSKRTLITSRDPKGLHAVGLFEAVYNKSKLDEARAQRLNERGGELQDGIAKLIAELSVSNQYANEEVRSSYTYPKEYKGPKPIADQIKALAKIFDLDPSHAFEFAKSLPAFPEGAEGWFAIPSIDALAKKHFPEVTDPAEMYCHAVQLVHSEIAASRLFYNCCEGQITPAQLRLSDHTAHAIDKIAATQPGDILIVAAQLGFRHRGKSVRLAREVFMEGEFGLGSLAVGSIILTHHERLVRWRELNINCSGDEFSSEADGNFAQSTFFYFDFNDDRMKFGTFVVNCPSETFPAVSGFLLQ
jgi:hypothetical protein